MSKIIKIFVSFCLWGISLFFLLGIFLTIRDAKNSVSYYVEDYLQVDYQGCELVVNPGELLGDHLPEGVEGSKCYRAVFQISNLSSVACYGDPAERLWWSYEVRQAYVPGTFTEESKRLFDESAKPGLPGKTTVTSEVYLFVEPDTPFVTMTYAPNWETDEVSCKISLDENL